MQYHSLLAQLLLKAAKRALLRTMKGLGTFALLHRSRWRRERLLILCYHGVSLDDEHEWNSELYMQPVDFEARLALLRKNGCSVLPLGEALARLYREDLPPRSAAITFDDGGYDFYARALPLLKSYGYPATVYLTTYYCERQKPVFDMACYYLLWKGRGGLLDGTKLGLDQPLDLRTDAAVNQARWALLAHARKQRLDTEAKDALLRALARASGAGYDELAGKRLFHLMTPEEVRRAAHAGIDFQLHTHRHRTPLDRELFLEEINENRRKIQAFTGREPRHFCYPSGIYRREFLPWLAELSVASATTCESGLASPQSNPLLLPRLVDHTALAPIEFEGWLTGWTSLLPRRPARAPGPGAC